MARLGSSFLAEEPCQDVPLARSRSLSTGLQRTNANCSTLWTVSERMHRSWCAPRRLWPACALLRSVMPAWPSDVTVLVTGGNGFIGDRLISRLHAGRARVRLLSRDGLRDVSQATTVIGDVTLPDSLAAAAEGCEVIFHCAAIGGGSLNDVRAVNVEGTRNVLHAAVRAGARRVIHLSAVADKASAFPDHSRQDHP